MRNPFVFWEGLNWFPPILVTSTHPLLKNVTYVWCRIIFLVRSSRFTFLFGASEPIRTLWSLDDDITNYRISHFIFLFQRKGKIKIVWSCKSISMSCRLPFDDINIKYLTEFPLFPLHLRQRRVCLPLYTIYTKAVKCRCLVEWASTRYPTSFRPRSLCRQRLTTRSSWASARAPPPPPPPSLQKSVW